MKLYIFPLVLICFGVVYYVSYLISGSLIEILRKRSILLAGIVFSIGIVPIFYTRSLILIFILTAMISIGSSIIDYNRNGRSLKEARSYLYTSAIMGIVLISEYFVKIRIIYVFSVLAIVITIFSILSQLSGNMNINYRKTTIIKKLKRYVISITDIKRIKNMWTMLYAISINVLIFISIGIILITVPVLVLNKNSDFMIFRFLEIVAVSFFALFVGSIINARIYYGISFTAIFPLLLLIGFIISIKNTGVNLFNGFLILPAIALFFPGYRKYFTRKFPGSEIYYVYKFANFFSWIFILPVPFILLKFITIPIYTIIIELTASMIGLILTLKFTNYPEIVWNKNVKINKRSNN